MGAFLLKKQKKKLWAFSDNKYEIYIVNVGKTNMLPKGALESNFGKKFAKK